MKRCTDCGRTTASKLVYDLPCGEGLCRGTMISEGAAEVVIEVPAALDAADESFTDEPTEDRTDHVATVITVTTLPEMARKLTVMRLATPDRFDQVITFIGNRAAALDDLGATAAGDLLRQLIFAIQVEFRS